MSTKFPKVGLVSFGLTALFFSGCALSQPKPAKDPAYIAAFQKERQYWKKRASQVYTGMPRREVNSILPRDASLSGFKGGGVFVSAGKTRPQAHLEEWYYLSPHFICSIEYDFTGLNYDRPRVLVDEDEDTIQEFPSLFALGSDPEEMRALGEPKIILVESRRVKNPIQ